MTEIEFKKYLKQQTFNVYELDFSPEFIKNLPIKWDLWKNQDLTGIPEVYHVLWKTDWNWGEYSKMDMNDRMFMHDLWLEYKRWNVKNIIQQKQFDNNK